MFDFVYYISLTSAAAPSRARTPPCSPNLGQLIALPGTREWLSGSWPAVRSTLTDSLSIPPSSLDLRRRLPSAITNNDLQEEAQAVFMLEM